MLNTLGNLNYNSVKNSLRTNTNKLVDFVNKKFLGLMIPAPVLEELFADIGTDEIPLPSSDSYVRKLPENISGIPDGEGYFKK